MFYYLAENPVSWVETSITPELRGTHVMKYFKSSVLARLVKFVTSWVVKHKVDKKSAASWRKLAGIGGLVKWSKSKTYRMVKKFIRVGIVRKIYYQLRSLAPGRKLFAFLQQLYYMTKQTLTQHRTNELLDWYFGENETKLNSIISP